MNALSQEEQNVLVTENMALVGNIVAEVAARYPRHVDRGELTNAGYLGLVEASRRYDPESGIPFARYAAIRIKGSILDSTRTRDWASRSVRRNQRDIAQATAGIEGSRGREAAPDEIAEFLEIPATELAKRLARIDRAVLLQLDQPIEEDGRTLAHTVAEREDMYQPAAAIEGREMRGALIESIKLLPPAQAVVVSRYYLEGELLQDIATSMDITEARVSQIRSEALMAMRSFFATQYDGVQATPEDSPGKRARAAYLSRMSEQSTWRSRIDSEPEYHSITESSSAIAG